jgi:hypothetical protein
MRSRQWRITQLRELLEMSDAQLERIVATEVAPDAQRILRAYLRRTGESAGEVLRALISRELDRES